MSKSTRKRSTARLQITFTEPSLTQTEFAEEADINFIMSKYTYDDIASYVASNPPSTNYLDLSDPVDFQLNMDSINSANEAFADLPAKVRDRFNNNPLSFLEFVHDENNRDEMFHLGLLAEVSKPEPISTPAQQEPHNAEGAAPRST